MVKSMDQFSGKAIKEEILRVGNIPGKEVVLDKMSYLMLLHELKVLRFKVCRKKYWHQGHDVKKITGEDIDHSK